MRIKTAIENEITPFLQEHQGKIWPTELYPAIQRHLSKRVGKNVEFNFVTEEARELALADFKNSNTFSFNIITTPNITNQMNNSSTKRREKYRYLFARNAIETRHRFGIVLDSIVSNDGFTLQLERTKTGIVYPVGVIGFYGSNINRWCQIAGVKQTERPHKIPSTHFMDVSQATNFVKIFEF